MNISKRFRALTSGVALAATAILIAGCAGGSDDPGTDAGGIEGPIIWADYGGPTNESRQIAFFDGFLEDTGAEVVSVSIEDAIFNSMLEGGSGDYDVFQVSSADVLANSANLLEIPESARGDLLPDSLSPYVVGGFYIGIAQGWLTETYPDGGPQNWVDFFDTEKFPGLRAWPGAPGSYDSSYEIALLADGVAPEDLYPLDFERAEAKLDTIRGDLVFYQAYPEVQQLLSSGSAAIAVTVTGQFTALANAGMDVTVQWNEAFITANGFVVPAESSNPDAVFALAEWMNAPENSAVFTERTLYGPINSAVFDELSPEVLQDVANSPEHDGVIEWDEQWRADFKEDLVNNYTAWLAG